MRKIIFPLTIVISLAIISILSLSTFAQDKPKASEKPIETPTTTKEPPAEITIPAADAAIMQQKAQAAELANLRAQNFQLRIQAQLDQADIEMKKLSEVAKRATEDSNAEYSRRLIKAGVPGDQVDKYAAEPQPDGTLKLKRKPDPPPNPAPSITPTPAAPPK